MVYVRKYRRNATKYKRKSMYRRKAITKYRRQPRLTGPVPNSKLVKLRYVQSVSIDPTAGNSGTYTFSANSIYDPNKSNLGHQPYGHDTLETLYDRYTVVGSRITAEFTSTTPSNVQSVVGIELSDNGASTVFPLTWLEQPKSNWSTIGRADGDKARAKLSRNFSMKQFFGVKNTADVTQRLGADFGTDPTEQAYFHLKVAPLVATDDIPVTNILVTITYVVLCTELKVLGQS